MTAKKNSFSPAKVLVQGFLVVIFAGSILLTLRAAVHEGRLAYLDSLFTATSAVCVTGLVVVDTGTTFTLFGQGVIMLLIMIGSLGFMTMATVIFIFLGRKITLRDRLLIKEAMNTDSTQGLVLLTLSVVKLALVMIIIGACLLSIRFVPLMGLGQGLFYGLFHAVSAFGNAGFDLMGDFQSLTGFVLDPLVSGTIVFLFIVGGLGFTVILDLYQKRRFSAFSLHTKMVLTITGVLLFVGTFTVLSLEYYNPETLGGLHGANKVMAAFFTAATPRTAGFNVLPTDLLHPTTLFFIMLLMFIGASPTSTGGGIKTTTFGTLLLAVVSLIKGRSEVAIFERQIPFSIIMRSLGVLFISFVIVMFSLFILTITEQANFLEIVFEVFSAFGTVGLSAGITPDLSPVGRVVVIITMFVGRVGPLTMVFALAHRELRNGIHYPEERIMVG